MLNRIRIITGEGKTKTTGEEGRCHGFLVFIFEVELGNYSFDGDDVRSFI